MIFHRLRHSRFARNAATLQVGALVNGLGGVVSATALAHILGARLQGEYIVAIALYGFLALLVNMGFVQATVNQVAGAVARGKTERVADWLGFLAKSYLLLGLLLPVLGWFALPWMMSTLDRIGFFATGATANEPSGTDLAGLAWILTFMPLAELLRQLVAAALQGTRRMVLLTRLENSQELVRVVAVISGALLARSPLGPIIGYLCSSAVGSVIAVGFYQRARADDGHPLPSLRSVFERAPRVRLLEGMPLAFRIGVLRNVDALSLEVLPSLALQASAGSEWVTYFNVAKRIMNVPLMLMQGISRTALPAMSELKGARGMSEFRGAWTRITLFGGGLVAGGILACMPFIPFAVRLLYPDSYVEPVWKLALILAVGIVPAAFCIALDTFFIVVDRIGVLILFALSGLTAYCVATYVAVGLDPNTGVAWGFTVAKLWGLLTFGYIVYYFRTHRSQDLAAAG